MVLMSCEADNPPSIFNPDYADVPAPVITAIVPPDSTVAGLGEITIKGLNFASKLEDNYVYFNKTKVDLISASTTELKLKTPVNSMDSVVIKVAIYKSPVFSNQVAYRLLNLYWELANLSSLDDANGIAVDKNENVFISLSNKKIIQVTPRNLKAGQDYATQSFTLSTAMKVGPGGSLYIARNANTLHVIPPGGGTDTKWGTGLGRIYDFDFSPTGIIYAGGRNNDLYRIKPDGVGATITPYPNINIKTIRVYNGYVYVGGVETLTNHYYVWRNQIISDEQLGEREVVFDWSTQIDPNSQINCLTFSADGVMYIGTNGAPGIVMVHPDGSFESLYPGILEPNIYSFCWGNDQYLYLNRRNDTDATRKKVLKFNVQKTGAPYYGRLM
ncbi:IPT/TIG domain-containing protein [candidate division KSB1 bacterium]|nr:IPT/TIG domain-containing protein [candidate division KSB1 bacterium]